jgi:hypothetical protein
VDRLRRLGRSGVLRARDQRQGSGARSGRCLKRDGLGQSEAGGDAMQAHLRTVRGQTPAASATASGVCPLATCPYNPLSTKRREPGILVHVHPVLPRIAEASQLQLPRPGPDGQPSGSLQLDCYGAAVRQLPHTMIKCERQRAPHHCHAGLYVISGDRCYPRRADRGRFGIPLSHA